MRRLLREVPADGAEHFCTRGSDRIHLPDREITGKGEPTEMHMNVRLRRALMVGGALGLLTLTSACAYNDYGYGYQRGYYRDGYRHYRYNNPPGPVGGPGTNWANPPGPRGGPGVSPYPYPYRRY